MRSSWCCGAIRWPSPHRSSRPSAPADGSRTATRSACMPRRRPCAGGRAICGAGVAGAVRGPRFSRAQRVAGPDGLSRARVRPRVARDIRPNGPCRPSRRQEWHRALLSPEPRATHQVDPDHSHSSAEGVVPPVPHWLGPGLAVVTGYQQRSSEQMGRFARGRWAVWPPTPSGPPNHLRGALESVHTDVRRPQATRG